MSRQLIPRSFPRVEQCLRQSRVLALEFAPMSSITPAERITFILTRGVVALALVGAGVFCIAKGIGFWAVPRAEASQLGLDVLGLHLTAGGLGGVIFAAGIAICFFAYKTAPRGLESHDSSYPDGSGPKRGAGVGGGGLAGSTPPRFTETSTRLYAERPPG